MTTLADQHEREEAFINASDRDRLTMLASGDFTPTDRVLALSVQALSRALLNQQLGAKISEATPYKYRG
jgi:hypothetical protein